jgi:hypothetical protein
LDARNSKPDGCKAVPAVMWGHQTMTWTRSGYVQPRKSGSTSVAPRRRSSKSSTTKPNHKPNHNPKPFSIPFRPKAIHLLVRKAYLKPPPKLPPLHSRSTFITTPTHKTTPSPKCSSLNLDSKADDAYELFADALERALNSNEQTVGVNYVPEGPMDDLDGDDYATPWADHPFYDDVASDDAIVEVPWEEHPYYDTPDEEEDNHGPDASYEGDVNSSPQDTPDHRDEDQETDPPDEDASDDAIEEVTWEEHPYYDAPNEVEDNLESDASDVSIAWQDHSSYTTEEEDELAWEDSPFY